MKRTDDGGLYNPDGYGCRRRSVALLLALVAIVLAPCAVLGWWVA
jgi:hypothetical protein